MRTVTISAAFMCLILSGCGGPRGEESASENNVATTTTEQDDKLAQATTEEAAAIGTVQRSGNEWIVIEQEPGGAKRRQLTTTRMQVNEPVENIDLSRYDGKRVRFAFQTKDDDTYWGVDEGSIRPLETATGRVDAQNPQNLVFREDADSRPRRLTEQVAPDDEQVGQEPEAIPLTGITRQLTFEYVQKDNGWYYGVDRSSMKQAQQ